MHSKSRNTLSAFVVVAVFVASLLALSRPVAPTMRSEIKVAAVTVELADARKSEGSTDTLDRGSLVGHGRRDNRTTLNMPYFSFGQILPQRRAD